MNIRQNEPKTDYKRFNQITLIVGFLVLVPGVVTGQQGATQIEQRVERLEQYVSSIQPTIIDLSNNLNASIQEYTQGLEASLESYSQTLQTNLDERLKRVNQRAVVLNPFSKSYQSVQTNTGMFLIAVEKVKAIQDGVRLHMNIGNPNFADYQDFKLKLVWGGQWAGTRAEPYQEWRQSLNGLEYTFQGKIERGKWNSVTVDLIPTSDGQLGYLECEMEVSSVELGYN